MAPTYTEPEIDDYGEMVNDPETYAYIAQVLKYDGRLIFGWTDGLSSHFDILMTHCPEYHIDNRRTFQGGIDPTDLFISIMRYGSFAFDKRNSDKGPSYYSEKLRFDNMATMEKMTELFNGVIKAMEGKK